jgi:hypothetical protein
MEIILFGLFGIAIICAFMSGFSLSRIIYLGKQIKVLEGLEQELDCNPTAMDLAKIQGALAAIHQL